MVTGGAGSLGRSLIQHLLRETKVRRIAIFSRDELKQRHINSPKNRLESHQMG